MADEPVYDVMDKSSYRKTKEGREITRAITVKGIGAVGWYNKIAEAEDIIGATIGSAHPEISTIFLKSIEAIGVSGDIVELVYKYSQVSFFDDDTIEVGATVIQTETNKDKDDNIIEVGYIYPKGWRQHPSDIPLPEEQEDWQGKLVSLLTPELTWTKNKLEGSSPESKAITHVGKVNNSDWRGYPVGTWLCTGIVGRSSDGGDTYEVTYSFQYNRDRWTASVVYLKPDGKPPSDYEMNRIFPEQEAFCRANYLLENIEIYDDSNFNSLNLA